MLARCQAGRGAWAFTRGLQTTPDAFKSGCTWTGKLRAKDNSFTHYHFSCWRLIREKSNLRLRRYFSCLLLLLLEMVLHRTFYRLERGLSPFQRCCSAGCLVMFKTTHFSSMFTFIWFLWSSQQVSGSSLQPDFPNIWQESRPSAEDSSGNRY